MTLETPLLVISNIFKVIFETGFSATPDLKTKTLFKVSSISVKN